MKAVLEQDFEYCLFVFPFKNKQINDYARKDMYAAFHTTSILTERDKENFDPSSYLI